MRTKHQYGRRHGQSLGTIRRFFESNPPNPDVPPKPVEPPKNPDPPAAKQIDEHTVEIGGKRFVVQDKVNELVGTARTEGKTAGEQAAAAELDRKAKESQGEFEKLYTEAKPKLDDAETKLTAAEAETKKYRDEVEKDVAELLKSLPDKMKKLLPANLDPIAKRDWIRDAVAAFDDGKPKRPGGGPNPPAGGGETDEEKIAETRRLLRRTGMYGRL